MLLSQANDLDSADRRLAARLSAQLFDDVLAAVPDSLLLDPLIADEFPSADAARARYLEYLSDRLSEPRLFVPEAVEARERRLGEPILRRQARR
jgi:hypothetical protein